MQGLSQSDKIKSEKEIKILTQLGLSKDEAQVYHVLPVSYTHLRAHETP